MLNGRTAPVAYKLGKSIAVQSPNHWKFYTITQTKVTGKYPLQRCADSQSQLLGTNTGQVMNTEVWFYLCLAQQSPDKASGVVYMMNETLKFIEV